MTENYRFSDIVLTLTIREPEGDEGIIESSYTRCSIPFVEDIYDVIEPEARSLLEGLLKERLPERKDDAWLQANRQNSTD